jgi:hypothetical protein
MNAVIRCAVMMKASSSLSGAAFRSMAATTCRAAVAASVMPSLATASVLPSSKTWSVRRVGIQDDLVNGMCTWTEGDEDL